MANEDRNALMSSEIFRELIKIENLNTKDVKADEDVLGAFSSFENKILTDKKLLFNFKYLQNKIASDEVYRKSLDPKFVSAVMLLDLGEGQ